MIHLTTERLLLRDWRASDLDAWAAINADAEVRRYLGSGTPVDRIGLYQPPHFPDLEVNWLRGRLWWGRGLAYEAAAACTDHAFTRLHRSTISAFIDTGNERSMRLARRLGMADIGEPWKGVRQFQRGRET